MSTRRRLKPCAATPRFDLVDRQDTVRAWAGGAGSPKHGPSVSDRDTVRAWDGATASAARAPSVSDWFATNTFQADAFGDLDALVARKREQHVTISLGLPALDEEPTIGTEIAVLRRALMEETPLLDEIVVFDGGSSDRTVEVVRQYGVPACQHAEVLPGEGTRQGKGEALWKSLHVLRGDLIVWVDADIRNIDPRFVYGLLGPLLHEPRIGYVKGYYRRPLRSGDGSYETGGGRVTELCARPLLNLFFPELAGVIQPLAGEYAGRREILERLPFFTGYGVEIGLLIDILNRYGLDRIGQVGLGSRVHRNRELSSLSLAAFAIAQVVMTRVGERGRLPLMDRMHRAMTLIGPVQNTDRAAGRGLPPLDPAVARPSPGGGDPIRQDCMPSGDPGGAGSSNDGRLSLETREIDEQERPPIITVPAYRRRRVLLATRSGAPAGRPVDRVARRQRGGGMP
jgi:glycosyltransferase involved in cell wall biosynthesis